MSIYSLTVDGRVWRKPWKTPVRTPQHLVYFCTSDLPGKQQGCQQIDQIYQFPFTFDTEWEGSQFFSLCSQLAAAASHKGITKQLQDDIRSRPAEVQPQATTTTETVQNADQSATHNITPQIQAAMSSVQQYATTVNSSFNKFSLLDSACPAVRNNFQHLKYVKQN